MLELVWTGKASPVEAYNFICDFSGTRWLRLAGFFCFGKEKAPYRGFSSSRPKCFLRASLHISD